MSALAFLPLDLRHPHLVVVDGSKLVRKLLFQLRVGRRNRQHAR